MAGVSNRSGKPFVEARWSASSRVFACISSVSAWAISLSNIANFFWARPLCPGSGFTMFSRWA